MIPLYGEDGAMRYYLVGYSSEQAPSPTLPVITGLLYTHADEGVGVIVGEQVVGPQAQHLGWFDGAFLRDPEGCILAFAEGAVAQGGLTLPEVTPPTHHPAPRPLALEPLWRPRPRPEARWVWSRAHLSASTNDRHPTRA